MTQKNIYRQDNKEVMPETIMAACMGAEAEGRRQYSVYDQTWLYIMSSCHPYKFFSQPFFCEKCIFYFYGFAAC